MPNYNIQVMIDPSGALTGVEVIENKLEGVKTKASTVQTAVQRAFNFNAAPAVQQASAVDRALDGVTRSARATAGAASGVDKAMTGMASSSRIASGGLSQVNNELKVMYAPSMAAANNIKMIQDNMIRLYGTSQQQAEMSRRLAATETASLGQRRAGYQQLGFQIQDISMQAALGINPLTILAQQAGQTASAVVLMTGKVTGFWAFMAGPWGSVIIAAVAVLGSLAAAFIGSSHAAEEDTASTQHNLTATDALGQAKGALGDMFDLTTGKLRHNTDELRLNTLALAANLQAQAETQLFRARATIGLGNRLPEMMENMGNNGPGLLSGAFSAASTGPGSQSARANQEILARFGIYPGASVNGRNREAAMTALMARAMEERQSARSSTGTTRAQHSNAAEQTQRLVQSISDEQQAIYSQGVSRDMITSGLSGNLNSRFLNDHRNRGGGHHADPVGDFFRRLEQQQAIAGVPQGLGRRIMDANQDFTRAADRPPTAGPGGEEERIAALIRETEARETLLQLTQTYTDAAEREYQMLGELGVRRKMHNAVLEEQARLGRALDPVEEAVVREGVRNADAYRRQQAAIEALDGGLQEYSDNMEAYLRLLQAGSITQRQFNILVGATPFQRQVDDMDTAIGGMRAYDAQMRQIELTIARYHELIDQRARLARTDPNYLDPTAAAAAHAAVGGMTTGSDNNSIGVQAGGPTSLSDRMRADVERRNRERLRGADQQLGGQYEFAAERERLEEENRERLDIYRQSRELELLTKEEYDQRVLASQQRLHDQLAEMDRARYQTALHAASQGFGDLAEAVKGFAGEQSRVYRALFITSKAFAIAEAALGIQTAIAQAMKLPFPANIPAIAQAVTLGASILSNIMAIQGQFRDGGYTGDGDPSAVAGTVHKGEYVMPANVVARPENRAMLELMRSTGGYRGGGGGTGAGGGVGGTGGGSGRPMVRVIQHPGVDVEERPGLSEGEVDLIVKRRIKRDAPRAVADDLRNPNGRTSKAVRETVAAPRKRA